MEDAVKKKKKKNIQKEVCICCMKSQFLYTNEL